MTIKLSKKLFYSILGLTLFVNVIVIFLNPLYFDAAVYWFYGHHLQWVYKDAPPLIGTVTWLGIKLLGPQNNGINALALSSILLSMRFFYLLAKSMFNENIARVSTLIWLITPTTLHMYFRFSWSYHNLILLFSIMATYFFYEAGKTKKPKYFYFTSGAFLSQISSLALIFTLLLPLLILPSCRVFFKNKHFYLSLVLLSLIIAPYFLKLIQSDWMPFHYHLSLHVTAAPHVFFLWPLIEILLGTFNELNLFFAIGLALIVKNFREIKKMKLFYFVY